MHGTAQKHKKMKNNVKLFSFYSQRTESSADKISNVAEKNTKKCFAFDFVKKRHGTKKHRKTRKNINRNRDLPELFKEKEL